MQNQQKSFNSFFKTILNLKLAFCALSCHFFFLNTSLAANEKLFKIKSTLQPYDELLEIGEDVPLYNLKSKLWVENQKILIADTKTTPYKLKPLALGMSKVKIDRKQITYLVVPIGFKSAFLFWKKQIRQLAFVDLQFCEKTICLKGTISKFEEFLKIQNLMSQNNASLFLKLSMNEKVKVEVEKWYIKYFRDHEITPPKLIFDSQIWKVSLSTKDENPHNLDLCNSIGLFTEDNKNKIEISDNVKVSVKFIEVSKSLARQIGIGWPPSVQGGYNTSNGQIRLINPEILASLQASETNSDTKIIAEPNLVCRSGKEASFLAGGEIPIRIATENTKSVTWKQYGIQLNIKPLVDPLGQMSIEFTAEISTPQFKNSVDGIPTLSTNRVSSHFDLVNSKTLVISGLTQNVDTHSKDGIAYLTQIPVIGNLFSSQNFIENKSELVILVTPEVFKE